MPPWAQHQWVWGEHVGRTLHEEVPSGKAVGGIAGQVLRKTDICLVGPEGPKVSLHQPPTPRLGLLSQGCFILHCPH